MQAVCNKSCAVCVALRCRIMSVIGLHGTYSGIFKPFFLPVSTKHIRFALFLDFQIDALCLRSIRCFVSAGLRLDDSRAVTVLTHQIARILATATVPRTNLIISSFLKINYSHSSKHDRKDPPKTHHFSQKHLHVHRVTKIQWTYP